MKQEFIDGEAVGAIDEGSAGISATKGTAKRKPVVTLDADIFGDVDVNLTAILGHGSIAVRALLDLSEGSVLNLDTPLDGMIDLTLNNRVIARGEIVAVDDRFGVRITKIVAERA